MPRSLKDARIALVDFDLRKTKLQFGVQVLVDNPENLEAIRDQEIALTKVHALTGNVDVYRFFTLPCVLPFFDLQTN